MFPIYHLKRGMFYINILCLSNFDFCLSDHTRVNGTVNYMQLITQKVISLELHGHIENIKFELPGLRRKSLSGDLRQQYNQK